tara:strand:- start:1763 stop:2338 length:576 start_codon:yes stop_codon:yes gene_type:complete
MKITRQAEIRAVNQEDRTAEFIISNETVDRHGTVFKIDGWQNLDVYNRNAIVSYNHNAGGENPDAVIGTSVVYVENGMLVGKVTFEDEGDNELADKVWKKVNKGILKMASVGASVSDYRYGDAKNGEDSNTIYFTRQELLEWSVVSVGSNPDAFKRSADQIDQIKAELTPIEKSMNTATRIKIRSRQKKTQ